MTPPDLTSDVAETSDPGRTDGRLLQKASRAALWNTLFFPLLALMSLLFSVLIRRRFGLFSGVYDVLMGLGGALQRYSSMGIPGNLPKFLPEVSARSGPAGVSQFLRHVVVIRLALLGLLLLPFNLLAAPIARELGLGEPGALYIRLLSALVVARAVMNLMTATLNSFFAQFWTNLFGLINSLLKLAMVGTALLLGYGMGGVLGALVASVSMVALIHVAYVSSRIHSLSTTDTSHRLPEPAAPPRWLAGQGKRFFRFNSLIYLSGLLGFFGTMGFVAPGLALVQTTDEVALFAVSFNLAFTTMNLAIAGFRGLYKPIFARLRIRNDPDQLRRAFSLVTKGQLVVLIPAGMGLIVMSGDYIPLLFGDDFGPAVPIAWILVGFMYAATSCNLSEIMLNVDERYRAIFLTQSILMLMAPVFLYTAQVSGLIVAAGVFGGGRLLKAVAAYAYCRQLYGVRFPWAFCLRTGAIGLAMAAIVGLARSVWGSTPVEAVLLTALGIGIFGLGIRWANVLGPDEVDLLKRSGLPGREAFVAMLAPRHASR